MEPTGVFIMNPKIVGMNSRPFAHSSTEVLGFPSPVTTDKNASIVPGEPDCPSSINQGCSAKVACLFTVTIDYRRFVIHNGS